MLQGLIHQCPCFSAITNYGAMQVTASVFNFILTVVQPTLQSGTSNSKFASKKLQLRGAHLCKQQWQREYISKEKRRFPTHKRLAAKCLMINRRRDRKSATRKAVQQAKTMPQKYHAWCNDKWPRPLWVFTMCI